MRKYNDELLTQVLNEKWDEGGINAEVEVKSVPYFQMLTFRSIHRKKSILDYGEIAEEAIKQLKDELNIRLVGSKKVTLVPWEEGMLRGSFRGMDGKFWGDVGITIRLRLVYSPVEEIFISDADIEVARGHLNPLDVVMAD